MAKPKLSVQLTAAALESCVREVSGQARLVLRVKPKSKQERLEVAADGSVVLQVSAVPLEGKANARVLELIAAALGLPRSDVDLARGESSRNKELAIALSAAELKARLLRCSSL